VWPEPITRLKLRRTRRVVNTGRVMRDSPFDSRRDITVEMSDNSSTPARIFGCDFTSAPAETKPLVIAEGVLVGPRRRRLGIERFHRFVNYQSLSLLLREPGPWVMALDFPFGQPWQVVRDLGWPTDWPSLVRHIAQHGKAWYRREINRYVQTLPHGKRKPPRVADSLAKSGCAIDIHNPPVGVMFCEGAPLLLASPASVLPCLPNRDSNRVLLEAYPKLVAERVLGRLPYKNDQHSKQSPEQFERREQVLTALCDGSTLAPLADVYGVVVEFRNEGLRAECLDDPSGDTLDAVLCGVQAAAAARQRATGYGIPSDADPLEGWIADPRLAGR
jgi:hypothetical protein